MPRPLEWLASKIEDFWLRVVKWLNASFATISAAVVAAYEARPDAVKALLQQVPVWAYFVCAVPVFAFINHALKRAKNPS